VTASAKIRGEKVNTKQSTSWQWQQHQQAEANINGVIGIGKTLQWLSHQQQQQPIY